MKFQQMVALQKYLSSVKQFPRSYLVVHPQREERRKFLEAISALLQKNGKPLFFEAEETAWSTVYENLQTPSLFGGEEIIIWNGIAPKTLSEPQLETLISYVLSPSPSAFLLLGAESAKSLPSLYEKTKEKSVLLDFSEEKPWEKQKRIEQEVLQKILKAGKKIQPDVLQMFLQKVGFEALGLEGEVEKLLLYIDEKKDITKQDVSAITSSLEEATGWELSESLVFGSAQDYPASLTDLSFLLGFLGQVRFYLYQGRQVRWCLDRGLSFEEVGKALPSIRPTQLKKVHAAVSSKKTRYFDEALQSLYDVELLAKNSNLSAKFLYDLLQTKISFLKQTI